MKKNRKIIFAAVIAIMAILFLAIVYSAFGPKTIKGEKKIKIEIVDNQGESTVYETKTDAEFLRQALEELAVSTNFSISGDESDYGLYITEINGVTADYQTDNSFWAIYVNDEFGMNSLDTQPVTDQDIFKLVYEVYGAE